MNVAIRWLADEDFDSDIVRGVLRLLPTLDLDCASTVELRPQQTRYASRCAIEAQDRRQLTTRWSSQSLTVFSDPG